MSGAREAIFPTRMALTNTKLRLKGAQTGHSLLAKKRDALMTRFRAILRKVDEVGDIDAPYYQLISLFPYVVICHRITLDPSWVVHLSPFPSRVIMPTGQEENGTCDAISLVLDGRSHVCDRRHLVSGAGASKDGILPSQSLTRKCIRCSTAYV
jgi:hypothetical protein